MRNPVLVRKYADGLARALGDDREFASVGAEVRAFLELFLSREDLRRALVSPFVNARRKAAVLAEVLPRVGTGPKASRFLMLLLRHKRMRLLPEIVEALPEAWSEKHGVVTLEVASAVALTEDQIVRLTRTLEASEQKPVRLVFKTDPGLVGGLTVRKGHIVYDASVEGELAALQERLGHEQRLS
jgi:F-type H+-transporting ATPase subunit delta